MVIISISNSIVLSKFRNLKSEQNRMKTYIVYHSTQARARRAHCSSSIHNTAAKATVASKTTSSVCYCRSIQCLIFFLSCSSLFWGCSIQPSQLSSVLRPQPCWLPAGYSWEICGPTSIMYELDTAFNGNSYAWIALMVSLALSLQPPMVWLQEVLQQKEYWVMTSRRQ